MTNGKKVLMVIASENFRDEEYAKPREILEGEGVEVKVACSEPGERVGMLGKKALVDLRLDQVNPADFDGVVFVGGVGAVEYFSQPQALDLAREAYKTGKVIGAICIAPTILANAGILREKNATAFSSEENNLRTKGANYTGADVTVDGNIVTASGPEAAEKFGQKLVEVLGV